MKRTLDVSHLPDVVFGSRDPMWWGVTGIMCIEGMVFALTWATYIYLRGNFHPFPPEAMPVQCEYMAGANMLILLATCLPMHLVNRAAEREDLRGMRWGLIAATLLGFAFIAVRIALFKVVPFRWDSHAYGSIFWLTIGMHTVHIAIGCGENLLILALLFLGPVEKKHMVDIRVSGMYWYFVVALWIPSYLLLFLDPPVLRAALHS